MPVHDNRHRSHRLDTQCREDNPETPGHANTRFPRSPVTRALISPGHSGAVLRGTEPGAREPTPGQPDTDLSPALVERSSVLLSGPRSVGLLGHTDSNTHSLASQSFLLPRQESHVAVSRGELVGTSLRGDGWSGLGGLRQPPRRGQLTDWRTRGAVLREPIWVAHGCARCLSVSPPGVQHRSVGQSVARTCRSNRCRSV